MGGGGGGGGGGGYVSILYAYLTCTKGLSLLTGEEGMQLSSINIFCTFNRRSIGMRACKLGIFSSAKKFR